MKATVYIKPHGHNEEITVRNVRPEDAAWFEQHNIKISMEEDILPGHMILYADIGRTDEEGEPDEVIMFSRGAACIEALAELRRECEKALNNPPNR